MTFKCSSEPTSHEKVRAGRGEFRDRADGLDDGYGDTIFH